MPIPKVLMIICGDPRVSARPAEAIRIAAGVGTWKKTDFSIYLRDAGVLALSEYADEFLDEDNYTRYLPIAAELGNPIYVQKNAPLLSEIGDTTFKFREVTDEELADLAAVSDYVVRF